jgi:transposase
MEVKVPRGCGLDIHKRTVVACVVVSTSAGDTETTTRTFGTTRTELEHLASWLADRQVTDVAMESTGVYWQPIYNVLEDRFRLLLANAHHVKAVVGRKTDVKDAAWLAQLLRHGLIQGSVVPDRARRELRELTRYRTTLIRDRVTTVQRIAKTLEGGTIKLGSVVSDLQGVSAKAILRALAAGVVDAAALAELARGTLRKKLPQLREALTGQMGPHQQFLLTEQLAHLEELDERIAHLDAEVATRLRPFEAIIVRLDTIPGIGRRMAEDLLAELGTDLRRFPTAKHLAAWAGMAPGSRESAGRRRAAPARQGDIWLRTLLVEAAHAAGRMTHGYLAAQYRRLAARRGGKRAAVAVGHTILVIVYHLVTSDDAVYVDLGETYLDERDRQRTRQRAVARLERLGYRVTLETRDTAA